MAKYKISGVWKDANNVITHYAFHTVNTTGTTRAEKVAKAEAIRRLETVGNTAKTWLWSYKYAYWYDGEDVSVVNGTNGKYLRSNPDDKVTDNLGHLIDYDWITP